MAISGLQHFNLRIPESELFAAQTFYVEVLGLRLGPRPSFSSIGAWLYAGDRPIVHLTQMNSGETAPPGAPSSLPASVDERRSALDHVAMSCDDLAVMRERLERYHVEYRMTEVPAAREVQLFFRDPCGIGIELIFPLPAPR
jgi:catechol 2,3-dioxygenase-like lactoylglutathione lyase family enzyme